MPRPRRDSEILPAKERLENAFWDLLYEREYRKITVTDIVREAQVNRNSFYYHFGSLAELADSAILCEVEQASANKVTLENDVESSGEADDPDTFDAARERLKARLSDILQSNEQCEHINRLALIVGPHSGLELVESLRDFCRMSLAGALQLDLDHLDLRNDLALEFAVGGVLSILRRWPDLRSRFEPETLFSEDLATLAIGIYLSMSKSDLREYWNVIFRSDSVCKSHTGTITGGDIAAG